MKKFLTLLFGSMMTLAASAAVPELLFNGQPATDGATYETGYTLELLTENYDGLMIYSYNYTQDTGLSIRGDKSKSVTVNLSATSPLQFCGIDGLCNLQNPCTKSGVLSACSGAEVSGDIATAHLDIHAIKDETLFDGETPTDPSKLLTEITATVTAYYTDSPNEKVTVKVVLTTKPASEVGGIVVAPAERADVRYANGTLYYNIDGPRKLSVYTPGGQLVMSVKVSGLGSVCLDALRPGIYIYSLGDTTGKVAVRK